VIFVPDHLEGKLRVMLEDIVPHVRVVISGKDSSVITTCTDVAERGGQVILLKNSGHWVNQCVKALESEQQKARPQSLPTSTTFVVDPTSKESKESQSDVLQVSGTVPLQNFHVFDALTDSAERVTEKLTKALTYVSGDEMREMGFTSAEWQRLRYAWELVVLYRYNARFQARYARFLQYGIAFFSLATAFLATILSVSRAEPESSVVPVPPLSLPRATDVALGLSCAFGPLLSSFHTLLTSSSSAPKMT
jgi:hypothetical protein